MNNKKIRAQAIIEYVWLVIIVSLAIGAMTFYLNRKIEIRVRHLNEELNEASRGYGLI
ncbi:MAG: hypothetical protein JSW40_02665 [Candidatus Omnitrophota bacterium]|nr:MAG: hypothetical protein JSW40_02665 [Candidatus Omnitrophota bacterium]